MSAPARVHSSLLPPGAPIPKSDGSRTQRQRSATKKRLEMLYKAAAKIRDYHRCQFPHCRVQGRGFVESAHLVNAGMGGRFSVGNARSCFVTACHDHHQGAVSLHSGHVKAVPQGDGADGPLDWYLRHSVETDDWYFIGTSRPNTSGAPRNGTYSQRQA